MPGPSAVLTGLVLSGLPTEQFVFLGFPPRRKQERLAWLRDLANLPFTLVFYEAPHRISALLTDLQSVLGKRPAALVREISKQFEEVERGSLEELARLYTTKVARGEYVVVVGGAIETTTAAPSGEEAVGRVEQLVGAGRGPSEAIKEVARELGISRRVLYNRYHQSLVDESK